MYEAKVRSGVEREGTERAGANGGCSSRAGLEGDVLD